jgi:hypothetical protein
MCVSAMVLQISIQAQTTTTQPAASPPTSTGQKIVSAIAGIAGTFFPALQSVTDLFKPGTKIDPKTITTSVNEKAAKATDAATTTQTAQISKLNDASTDLATISTALHYCICADENLTTMEAILVAQKTPMRPPKASSRKLGELQRRTSPLWLPNL